MWIVKFVPYAGGMPTQGLYETQAAAEKIYAAAIEAQGHRLDFKDDWGFSYTVHTAECAFVLMDLETSIKMSIHLAQEQDRLTRKHGASGSPQGAILPVHGFVPRQ